MVGPSIGDKDQGSPGDSAQPASSGHDLELMQLSFAVLIGAFLVVMVIASCPGAGGCVI